MLKERTAPVSIKELSELTAIKTEDILDLFTRLKPPLLQYQKGQHVLCANPKIIDKCAARGSFLPDP